MLLLKLLVIMLIVSQITKVSLKNCKNPLIEINAARETYGNANCVDNDMLNKFSSPMYSYKSMQNSENNSNKKPIILGFDESFYDNI